MEKINPETLRAIVETNVFTIPEAAEYLGTTRQNILMRIKAGRIPVIRNKLVLKHDLDKYDVTAHGGPKRKKDVE